MEAKAVAKYIRISPRKAAQVADLVRGKSVGEAYAILKFTPNKGAAIIEQVLKSAVANAEHNYNMDVDKLYVSTIFVGRGRNQRYRRFCARDGRDGPPFAPPGLF